MPSLGYDEFKDHPIAETYKMWTKEFLRSGQQNPLHTTGINSILSDPGIMTQLILEDPGVRDALFQSNEALQRANAATRRAIGAQRASAAQQRAIQKKRLQFQLDTGLRDIEQGREAGLEAAVNNALQRGIYRSGVRIENEQEVERESDEAAGDLRTQIDLALQSLAAQARGADASFAAQQAQQDAANSSFLTLDDIAQITTEMQFSPLETPNPVVSSPAAPNVNQKRHTSIQPIGGPR